MDMLFGKDGLVTKGVESVPGGGTFTQPFHAAAGHREHARRAGENHIFNPDEWTNKDGLLTKGVECVPGGGFLTAPFHAAAGNSGHATMALATGALGAAGTGASVATKAGATGLKEMPVKWAVNAAGTRAATSVSKGVGYIPSNNMKQCPKGHALANFTTPKDGFGCNKCRGKVSKGATMMSCRQCDYDLCKRCC